MPNRQRKTHAHEQHGSSSSSSLARELDVVCCRLPSTRPRTAVCTTVTSCPSSFSTVTPVVSLSTTTRRPWLSIIIAHSTCRDTPPPPADSLYTQSPLHASHLRLCQRFWATVSKTVRPMLSDRCPVCPVCLSVTLVYCGQTVGWIKMKLGMEVGLGSGHTELGRNPALSYQKGRSPQFSAHVRCSKTAGWIKMPLGMVVSK